MTTVQHLFNQKAGSWQQKYAANGPLRSRLDQFAHSIQQCAPAGGTVLDLGCGSGSLAVHLSAMGYAVTACDIAERMIDEGVKANPSVDITWTLLQPSWRRLPFETGTFDVIVASSLIEYVDSVDDVLAECRRTLRPGGFVIFTAPNPAHRIRRLEAWFRPIACSTLSWLPLALVPRIAGYVTYLRSSRNRMSADGWKQVASRAGLIAAADWLASDDLPLMLMRVSKT